MRHKAAVGLIGMWFGAAAWAAPGDALVITGDGVNVRARPSLDATVLVQSRRGEQAVELARQGEWVEVRLGEAGVQGWIHESLLAPADVDAPADTAAAPLSEEVAEALERFRSSVDYLGWRAAASDRALFAGVRWLGPGRVQVEVTPAWNEVSPEEQAGYLDRLFDRWLAATGSPGPLRVEIVDPGGELVMTKTGP